MLRISFSFFFFWLSGALNFHQTECLGSVYRLNSYRKSYTVGKTFITKDKEAELPLCLISDTVSY